MPSSRPRIKRIKLERPEAGQDYEEAGGEEAASFHEQAEVGQSTRDSKRSRSADLVGKRALDQCDSGASSPCASLPTADSSPAHFDRSCSERRKRLAANARERKRMNLLNKAFNSLRRRLRDAENKSKYDVLVQAIEYIQALSGICAAFDKQPPAASVASKESPAQAESPSSVMMTMLNDGDARQRGSRHQPATPSSQVGAIEPHCNPASTALAFIASPRARPAIPLDKPIDMSVLCDHAHHCSPTASQPPQPAHEFNSDSSFSCSCSTPTPNHTLYQHDQLYETAPWRAIHVSPAHTHPVSPLPMLAYNAGQVQNFVTSPTTTTRSSDSPTCEHSFHQHPIQSHCCEPMLNL